MKDKTRLLLIKITGVIVVTGIIGFLGYVFIFESAGGLSPDALFWLLVPAILVIVILIMFLRRLSTSVKKGLPIDDEMSQRVKERAGYLSFLITSWFIIGLMWYHFVMEELGLPDILARHIIVIILLFSFCAFGLVWFMLSRRGIK